MKIEIKVPSMGESITQATIGTILKPSGSYVEADEEIVELETDKVNQVLHAPEKGALNLNISTGDVVKIGQTIGFVDTEAAAKESQKTRPDEGAKKVAESPKIEPKPSPKETSPKEGARFTTQAFVDELKNEEKNVPKQEEAVSQEISARKAPIASGEQRETRKKMSTIRKVIAKRLVESQQTTAMLTTFNEVDMTTIMALREKYKESFIKQYGVKLGFMSFFVKACVEALKIYPELNSYIEGEDVVQREYYNINVAVSTNKGVFVPVLRNCDALSFSEIEKMIELLAKKAREGTLTADDLKGGGFTITNGGVFGSLLSTPILNPPQTGILGMHKIEKRPVVIDDQIQIRPMMYLALSYDHRIVDGKEAVTFLVAVKNFLEDPSRILLEIKE